MDVIEVQIDCHNYYSRIGVCFTAVIAIIYVVFSNYDNSLGKSKELVLYIFTLYFPLNSCQMKLLQNLPNIE